MTKSHTSDRRGFSRKPITGALPELVRCSCGVRLLERDVEGHRERNPTHVVMTLVPR